MQEIREIRFDGKVPSIAYTDFSCIYLSWLLKGGELEVARAHELAHIWLQHQQRKTRFAESLESIDHYCWNIAADLEIAKYIYTDYHNSQITKPRSLLAGGITSEHVKPYKGEYAEEFYMELMEKKEEEEEKGNSFDADGNQWGEEEEGGDEKSSSSSPAIDVSDVVEQAIKNAVEQAAKEVKAQQTIQLHKVVEDFKPPKPSLASEIDKAVGRNKLVRISSYKRPNRRESDFLLKGKVSKRKAAKITLYVDRSGSFDATKTMAATSKVSEVMRKYRGKIDRDVIYFNNTLLTIDPINGGGGTNYRAVADDIRRNSSDLSIVITDDDGCESLDFKVKTKVLVIPVGCTTTNFAKEIGAVEV